MAAFCSRLPMQVRTVADICGPSRVTIVHCKSPQSVSVFDRMWVRPRLFGSVGLEANIQYLAIGVVVVPERIRIVSQFCSCALPCTLR